MNSNRDIEIQQMYDTNFQQKLKQTPKHRMLGKDKPVQAQIWKRSESGSTQHCRREDKYNTSIN